MAESDEDFMGQALEQAGQASLHGDVPIGCVIVDAERVVARAHNRREVDGDPTAHAEILALREAARQRPNWRLEDTTVFVTLEPCAMCAGALVNARIGRLVYGAPDSKAGAVDTLFSIGRDGRLNHRFEVTSGVRALECSALLQAFFAKLRAQGEK